MGYVHILCTYNYYIIYYNIIYYVHIINAYIMYIYIYIYKMPAFLKKS